MKDYRISRNPNYDISYAGTEEIPIGKVVSKRTKKAVMYLMYDKKCYEKYNQHCLVLPYKDPSSGEISPDVIMGDFYRSLFYENPRIFNVLAMHELGHYLNGDLTQEDSDGVTGADPQHIRIEYIKNGEVMPEELNADIFAAEQCGWADFRDALNVLIRRRKERNDAGMELAIREFELRKEHIMARFR